MTLLALAEGCGGGVPAASTGPGTAGGSSPATAHVALPERVVVVVIDTARWDRVGAMGGPCSATPHLDDVAVATGDRYALVRAPGERGFDVSWYGVPLTLEMPARALWDLEADPLGLLDVSGEQPAEADALEAELCAHVLAAPYGDHEPGPSDVRTMCEETAAR